MSDGGAQRGIKLGLVHIRRSVLRPEEVKIFLIEETYVAFEDCMLCCTSYSVRYLSQLKNTSQNGLRRNNVDNFGDMAENTQSSLLSFWFCFAPKYMTWYQISRLLTEDRNVTGHGKWEEAEVAEEKVQCTVGILTWPEWGPNIQFNATWKREYWD